MLAGGPARYSSSRRGNAGHVFSLGHGVLRETEPENLREIVRMVHETTELRS